MVRVLRAAAIAALFAACAGASADVIGAGATFPSNVYLKWAQQYRQDRGVGVSYRPTGSGDGVKQITDRAVQFGGSDTPLSPADLAEKHLVQIPMVIGGIVPVVNLPGVADAVLQLDGPTLAEVMLGRIARWDDPRIAALNPELRLPPLPIRRIVRAERSGTTDGFTHYLSQLSPAFAQAVGASQLPKWPGDVVRAEGNDGMAKAIRLNAGAVAYVSYDRVVRDGLAGVRLRNASGAFVKASETGFRSAIIQSELGRTGNDLASLIDRPGAGTWPITSATFVLIDATPRIAETVAPVMTFLYWCFLHGDDLTKGTGFAPLPTTVQARLAARFASVKAQDGETIGYVTY